MQVLEYLGILFPGGLQARLEGARWFFGHGIERPGYFDRLFPQHRLTTGSQPHPPRPAYVYETQVIHSKSARSPFRYTMKVKKSNEKQSGIVQMPPYRLVFSTNRSPRSHRLCLRMSEHIKPYQALYSLERGIRRFRCMQHSPGRFCQTLATGLRAQIVRQTRLRGKACENVLNLTYSKGLESCRKGGTYSLEYMQTRSGMHNPCS